MIYATSVYNLELTEGLIEGDNIKDTSYNLSSTLSVGFVNVDLQGECYCLIVKPNVSVNTDGLKDFLPSNLESKYALILPTKVKEDLYKENEKLRFSLKGSISLERNSVNLIDVVNRLLTQVEDYISYFESANNTFNADSTGQTPMITIATETAMKVSSWKKSMEDLKTDFDKFRQV